LSAVLGVDGKIYAIGGQLDMIGSITVTEAYDPATNEWTTLSPMPTPRLYAASARGGDDRIYVMGGIEDLPGSPGPNHRVTEAVEAYDPVTDTWSRAAPMPLPRYAAAAAARDGKIIVTGGRDRAQTERAEVQIYSP